MSPSASLSRQFNYLAAFDPGNASIRWPQKDARTANREQTLHNRQIERILKLNLLWRPSVTVRHIDVFDNLALAKFLIRNEGLCKELALAGLLTLCSPIAGSFEEILRHWAFGSRSGAPMHWHHLTPEQQRQYDLASKRKNFGNPKDLQKHLQLGNYGISLDALLRAYDSFFPAKDIVVTRPSATLGTDWYADRVEKKWIDYRSQRKRYGFRDTAATGAIEATLEQCWTAKDRRRAFYNNLEQAVNPAMYADDLLRVETEIIETKCLVLNDAFFDEVECFDLARIGNTEEPAIIVASRDVRPEWFPPGWKDRSPENWPDASDALISATFCPLDAITLSDVLLFHTAKDPESTQFQVSVSNLNSIHARSRSSAIPQKELSTAVEDHLKILRQCALRLLRATNRESLMHAARAKVYLDYPNATYAVAGSIATTAVTSLAASAYGMIPRIVAGVVAAVSTGLITIRLEQDTVTNEWLVIETALREAIVDSTDQSSDAR